MSKLLRPERLAAGRDYIADRCFSRFRLEEVADATNMSPYHFLRKFKHTYGETPNEFLIRLRIEHAKKLLVTGNFSISEVCERVGYASLGSFSSLFLREVGCTPSSYRKRLWAMSCELNCFPYQAIPACYAYHFLNKSVF